MRAFVIRAFVCVDSSGIDNNPTVFYHLMPGSTAQTNKFHTFYLQQRAEQSVTWADIKVNHPLDYESIKEYNLTIRVEVRGPPPRRVNATFSAEGESATSFRSSNFFIFAQLRSAVITVRNPIE